MPLKGRMSDGDLVIEDVDVAELTIPDMLAQRDELLASLRGVVDAWEDRSGMGTLYQMPRALSRARAAIARAESQP